MYLVYGRDESSSYHLIADGVTSNHLAVPKTLLHAQISVEVDDDPADADNILRGVFQCGTLLVKNCANRLLPKNQLPL